MMEQKTRGTSPQKRYYYAHTMPGLEEIAWSEIQQRAAGAAKIASQVIPEKNGLVLFDYAGPPADLLRLRTTEDIFFLVERLRIARGYQGLEQIHQALLTSRALEEGLALHKALHHREGKRRLRFRVISRLAGQGHPYRRLELGQTVAKALSQRSGSRWQAVEEGEDFEVWVNLIGLDCICGLRLSDATMRHRDYKAAHIAASLRPSVAAAMVWLTEPQATDIFLDPFCGAGTLLIERGSCARHKLLVGGDLDPAALRAAAENIGPRHKPCHLLRWDARYLPLAEHSVDVIATNPPFGKKIGSHEENVSLYRRFLAEAERVLAPQGRLALVTGEVTLMDELLRESRAWRVARSYAITLLGERAKIYLLKRRLTGQG
jgi:tRNA (guanine6-N2)-methyltransferase